MDFRFSDGVLRDGAMVRVMETGCDAVVLTPESCRASAGLTTPPAAAALAPDAPDTLFRSDGLYRCKCACSKQRQVFSESTSKGEICYLTLSD